MYVYMSLNSRISLGFERIERSPASDSGCFKINGVVLNSEHRTPTSSGNVWKYLLNSYMPTSTHSLFRF